MLNTETLVVPTSPVTLKDILQNKESLLNDTSNDSFRKMQETPNQQVNHDKIAGRSGKPTDRINRTRSENCSERARDEESICLDRSRIDETDADYSKSDMDDNASNDDAQSEEESKGANAVHVEDVLTDIQFPAQYMDINAMYGINDVRRQKRKQNVPQQHEQTTKIRRLDGPPYEEELWNLRHHLNAVQNYFRHYDVTHPKLLNGFESMENINRLHQAYFANLTVMHNEQLQKESNIQNKTIMAAFDRKVPSANDSFNIAKHVRETVNANTRLSQSVAELNEKELTELIGSMKSKIEEAVNVTVNKELLKFFQKRNINTTNDSSTVIDISPRQESNSTSENQAREQEKRQTTDHSLNHILQMPDRHNTNNPFRLPERHSAFELPKLSSTLPELPRAPFPHHPPLGYPPLSFYLPTSFHPPPLYSCPIVPPEQTEALALVVNTPKKKRTKVTDTRLSPRAARALLQENGSLGNIFDHAGTMSARFGQLNHQCLPTSVAIPNPSLQHSDILNFYKENGICASSSDNDRNTPCSSNSPSENGYSYLKGDFYNDSEGFDAQGKQITDTLTPMHLRKAKLMFFYVRYPSSAILKAYFPDVQFNKNNTAQLVKWFSNFREFYYIQMEKYARQAIIEGCKHAEDSKHSEGCKHTEDLVITADSELYRVLNLHYNRNNQIEVPENFRITVQATLREFYLALIANKDAEPSWKKPIYKVIARIDDVIPEYFKSPNWMDQLGES